MEVYIYIVSCVYNSSIYRYMEKPTRSRQEGFFTLPRLWLASFPPAVAAAFAAIPPATPITKDISGIFSNWAETALQVLEGNEEPSCLDLVKLSLPVQAQMQGILAGLLQVGGLPGHLSTSHAISCQHAARPIGGRSWRPSPSGCRRSFGGLQLPACPGQATLFTLKIQAF